MIHSNITNTDDTTVGLLCMQLLDASLSLLPMPELTESIQNLLARVEANVSDIPHICDLTAYPLQIRQQVLRSFRHRLKDKNLDLKASQAACLAFLPHLASVITESSDVSLKHTAVGCVDRITELFGKKDVTAIIASAKIIAGHECLGASESSLQTISMLCLATMVEVLSDGFISILPLALPKAMDSLTTSFRIDAEDDALHNAVYSFLGALILYVPWMIEGADLESVLKLSFESANAEMGEECDQSRRDALRLVPKKVEAKECLAALDKTWAVAMSGGPLVSRKGGL